MADVNLSEFLPGVLPAVDTCPRGAAILALRDTAIAFCAETLYDQRDMTPISTVADQQDYAVPLPAGYDLAHIINLAWAGYPMFAQSIEYLDMMMPASWKIGKGSQSTWYTVKSIGNVSLVPIPDAINSNVITGTIAVKPSRTSDLVGAKLYSDHYETLCSGALARLMMQSGKPWYNPNQAAYHAGMYRNGMVIAKVTVAKGFTTATIGVSPLTMGRQ